MTSVRFGTPESRQRITGRNRDLAMPATTITIALDGNIPLDIFAEGMQRFQKLVKVLSDEVSGSDAIDWYIEELASGSAVATIRGEAAFVESVERVVRAYSAVGRALETGETIPYSKQVADAARHMTSLVKDPVESIRFQTDTETATITPGAPRQQPAYLGAFGAVTGRIETLRSRGRLSFTLYDELDDRAVHCSLHPGQTELVRDAWGHRAIVEGRIKREPITGRAIEIAPVERITTLPDAVPGSYRHARGIAPAEAGEPSTEVVMRRLRDA